MRRLRVHVVYEHGQDLAPFGAAELRLLRPLSHPSIKPWLEASFGRSYDGRPVDAVILDRLICPRMPPRLLDALIERVRDAGAVLIHAMDDDFLDLSLDRPRWAATGQVRTLQRLLHAADGLMLTTEPLARRLADLSDNIVVMPNLLDERLIASSASFASDAASPRPSALGGDPRPLTLGYMGTLTHAEDLAMILPALRDLHARHPGRFELEVVGVADPVAAGRLLDGLPWRWVEVPPGCSAYPAFMRWFTGTLAWDLALAPLTDTPFTRCKSDLKHLDYAALGAAGIFSHVPAYSATVRHGETGWLAANQAGQWEAGLARLLADAGLRRRLARNAQAYLMRERTLAARGFGWVEALQSLIAGAGPGRGSRPSVSAPRSAPSGSTDEATAPPAFDPGDPPPARLAVLYEYGHGQAYEPHASAHLRLIRPLTHPAAGGAFEPRFRPRYEGEAVEAVLLDRLWRPDVTMERVEALIARVRADGAKLIHTLDDNLLDLRAERGDWPSAAHEAILRLLLQEADAVLVTGEPLAERLRAEAPEARIRVLPNALDERLLGRGRPAPWRTPFGERPLTIGYMGTATHEADLKLVLPALKAVCDRHPGKLQVALIGVLPHPERLPGLADLPLSILRPHPADREYTRFLPWFTASVGWDIAIAPLLDTPFGRCKSDIKFLDGCAIAAAMICSDMPAYSGSVQHGETGWLAENRAEAWEDALEHLIAEAEQRLAIAAAGRRYLHRERVLARRAPDWVSTIGALL